MAMHGALRALGLLCVTTQAALAVDRIGEVETLVNQYDAAVKAHYESPWPKEMNVAEQISAYEAWPGWEFIPRFLKLAEAQPDDEAAYRSCQWIIDRMSNVGNVEKTMFEADEAAWNILGAHHTQRAELPMMCLRSVVYFGPARERFLRDLLAREDLSKENRGFATIALAELLAHKCEFVEFTGPRREPTDELSRYNMQRMHPDWGKDLTTANASKFKSESIELFREVLARHADIPVTISAPYFRDLKNLGEKAGKSLYALEHLSLGATPPNIVGKDLQGRPMNLDDYRGKVVMLSFWFTGCGPCLEMIPQEQKLVEKYKDRPFVLLGVCTDPSVEQAQQTAAEHKMDWPCWFDGQDGPIAHDWNVLSWPTVYILDKNGIIVAKNLRDEDLNTKIAQIVEANETAGQ
jgi:thiol-disulfide isomerase/thioredoxin